MKKLIFAFALLMGTMFVSCNNGSNATDNTVDSVVTDSVVVDSVSTDTIM